MDDALGEERLAALWDRWLAARRRADRDALIRHYLPLVAFLARRIGRSVHPASRPDLAGFGAFGLMDAVERFDRSYGVPFESYAARRIKGAIADGIRTMSYFPRGAERRASRIIETLVAVDFQTARTPFGTRLDDSLVDRGAAAVDDGVVLAADHEEVVEAIRALAPRDRYVIEQHYFASRLLKEIGDDLGVTESRVSQLHRRALRALEAALRERISA